MNLKVFKINVLMKIPVKVCVYIKEDKCIQNPHTLNAAFSFAKVAVSGDRKLCNKSISIWQEFIQYRSLDEISWEISVEAEEIISVLEDIIET